LALTISTTGKNQTGPYIQVIGNQGNIMEQVVFIRMVTSILEHLKMGFLKMERVTGQIIQNIQAISKILICME
jgi:hypothetical protein